MVTMKWRARPLPLLVILLAFLLMGAVAVENARPPFVGKNIQESQLAIPAELHEYDYVKVFSLQDWTNYGTFSFPQALPFVLLRVWNDGTLDGTVDLWFVNNEEFTFLDTIRGDARGHGLSSIAYKDDGTVAFFHVGRGGLWMIDGSTKEVKMVRNGLGTIRKFSVMEDGSLYFLVKSRKELWTSDWTKEGTVMVQSFDNSLRLFSLVTDGFVLQMSNSSLYYWDTADRSTSFLPDIRIEECAPSDVAAIQGDNGSKGLIAANGLWSVGRHAPKRLAENFWWVSYIGTMKNEVLLNLYDETSSFLATDGERFRELNVQLDGTSSRTAPARIFGPFANNAHSMFMGQSFLSFNDENANKAELVATFTGQEHLTGFIPLPEENKVLVRSVSKLWEFDATKNEIRLLVDWDEDVYKDSEDFWGRNRLWDTLVVFRDGSLLMPMRKIAMRHSTQSPLEFWSIQLNANTDEFNATAIAGDKVDQATTTSADDGEPNATPPTTGGEPNLDDYSSSPMLPLIVARLGAAVLLVLFGSWM